MKKVNSLRLVISIIVLFALFFPVTLVSAQSGPAEDHAGGLRDQVELTLHADGAPLPGGTAQLSLEAIPFINSPEMEIRWFIPSGVQLIGNEVDSFSNVLVNKAVSTARVLSFPTAGTYKIAVSVTLRFAPDASYGTSGVLFFVIDPSGSRVTDRDPEAHRPVRHSRPGEVTITTTPSTTASMSPDEDPCFTISAHFDRIERPVTKDGYGAEYRIPLAGIGVEFRESDLLFDDSYGTLGTDANGNVIGSFCDDDGLWDDTLEIYLRLTAERGDPIVYVEDSSWLDEIYEYDTPEQESDGGYLEFTVNLGHDWSGIFNIIDAAWQARQLWVDSGHSFPDETEIHWEDGYGDETSSYNEYYNEITISDAPSDPDQWDEAIVIHEWGHFADDLFSCDDNPGDDHAPGMEIDPELAWGEGYPSYYSSAVRDTFGYPYANYMIDINGAGIPGNLYNLEEHSYPISVKNQGSISAALWDLYDPSDYYPDLVSHGHAAIQSVYTSAEFNDAAYGLFDDTCDFDTYMRGWVDKGMPTDKYTAAVVQDNTGYTLIPSKQLAEYATGNSTSDGFSTVDVYRWWKQLTYVADNSSSMFGSQFNAMKALFIEAVNDLGNDPKGTEFTLELFNNTSSTNDIEFAGQFFPEILIDPINALTTLPDADPNCDVYALRALAQAVDNKEKSDVWLFTDGDTVQNPSVENIRQLLNENRMRASIALMGICQKAEQSGLSDRISAETLQGLTPEEQQSLMAERLVQGAARTELGLMADDVPDGIVPYLLTAINSGGQFLYVDESQVEDAADILRAQITNSAGAGRWSDYVSDLPTYEWDELASWEYEWIDARYGTNRGNPTQTSKIDVPIPGYFQYFSGPYYDTIHVFEEGYVTLGLHTAYVYNNTELPNPAEPNNALYPLWNSMEPFCPPANASSPEVCEGYIYTLQQGDWYALEYYKYMSYLTGYPLNNFEILFNLDTGEIRYQYESVPSGAASATIGLENSNGTNGIQISYNDVAGADDGMGYKFTPAPPQPTRTYTVTVDSTMESVGFLLTGYSGSFEPLEVTDPDGTLVDCTAPGTLCLDLDLVQYVQVNTNGRTGDWHALVDAGNTGAGTFSFTSFAASPIAVESSYSHTLSTGSQQLLVQLTGQVDGCVLSGLFHKPDGTPFGYGINFYDDGLHNDNGSCDGLFGSGSFYLGAGSAYLTLQGLHNGEPFVRIDPVLYTIQPLRVTSMGDGANYGGVTELQFQFSNYDIHDHCYWITYDAPEGWWIDFPFALPLVCVDAGQTEINTFDVYMTAGVINNLPSGTTGILTLSASELEKGAINDSTSARITRHRQPYRIEIFNPTHYLRPNGDTVVIELMVFDVQNVVVADGTLVSFFPTNGSVSPEYATTVDGYVRTTFTSGPNLGTAGIAALTENYTTASTEFQIGNPMPSRIELQVSPNRLPADGLSTATLVATVRDRWGDPSPNQLVRIGVEGDGQVGTISGDEVVEGYTNADGQFSAIFTSGETVAAVGVGAELVMYEGGSPVVVHHDRKVILVGYTIIHLPLVER